MRDHYAVLGVEPSATAGQIAAAYRRLVRTLHPDARPGLPAARERFDEVVAAYSTLRDPSRRAAYDADRDRDHRRAPARPANFAGSAPGRPVTVTVVVSGPMPADPTATAAAGESGASAWTFPSPNLAHEVRARVVDLFGEVAGLLLAMSDAPYRPGPLDAPLWAGPVAHTESPGRRPRG